MQKPQPSQSSPAIGAALDRAEVSKAVRQFLDSIRPSEEIRPKLDFGFRFHGQSVELLEIRPIFKRPGKTEHAFAKATCIKSRGIWKVYWKRGNGKWHPYEPAQVRSLDKFLRLVREDKFHCFFG